MATHSVRLKLVHLLQVVLDLAERRREGEGTMGKTSDPEVIQK